MALYGSPSTVADGWIANLPAAEVFAGDFSVLRVERLIDAQDAHERCPFHTTFYGRHVRQAPQPGWLQQAPASAAGSDPKLTSAALRHLNTARVLATRLAREARRDNRPEDQQRYLANAADASLKAADLQRDAEAPAKLREQAQRQLLASRKLSIRLFQQARTDKRPEDQQRWQVAAGELSLKASELEGDVETATKMREQGRSQLMEARNLTIRLIQQAHGEKKVADQQRWQAAAGELALKALSLQGDGEPAGELREQARRQLAEALKLSISLLQQARAEERCDDEQRWHTAAGELALKAAELERDGKAAGQLRKQALRHLMAARKLSIRLLQQARGEGRVADQQQLQATAGMLSLKAAELLGDEETAEQLREHALRHLMAARRLSIRLLQRPDTEKTEP